MKILHVIHGYPPRFNAGSEVYTQTLCRELSATHEMHVFTRFEDPFLPEFTVRTDADPGAPGVALHTINIPRGAVRYRHGAVDKRFGEIVDQVRPHVVHIGHLMHLSTSLVNECAVRGIPVVYTLHDYWLMCPRGQFLHSYPAEDGEMWPVCSGQSHAKCARRCYGPSFVGSPEDLPRALRFWTYWVDRRMTHVRDAAGRIDLFIAPSRTVLEGHLSDFDIPASKLVHLDYGFDLGRLTGRKRTPAEPFTFGYIGTHIPAKGIHHLIEAFAEVRGAPLLRIWGRPHGQETDGLKTLANSFGSTAARIEWMGEYRNEDIVSDVFNHVDAIVVPSIWAENSPLVIHEAQHARVPVITANAGGMAEYVRHEVNGLLFAHRDPSSLTEQMERLVDYPALAASLGARGYLYSESGDVPDIGVHARQMETLYEKLLERVANLV